MAHLSIRLWVSGWDWRWSYEKTAEKIESGYGAQSDVETSDEDETTHGAKMRSKFRRNLRLGARRKLRTAKPVQLGREAKLDKSSSGR